jgi:hypothetical protein
MIEDVGMTANERSLGETGPMAAGRDCQTELGTLRAAAGPVGKSALA